MTPSAILAELRDLGAVAYRVGDMIRLGPTDVLTPEILAAVREQKAALLPALPVGPPPIASSEDVMPPPERWHVKVGPMNLQPAPIRLDRGRVVVGDVMAFVESVLVDLEVAVWHRNMGTRSTLISGLADEYIDHLRLCGVEVSVELVQ